MQGRPQRTRRGRRGQGRRMHRMQTRLRARPQMRGRWRQGRRERGKKATPPPLPLPFTHRRDSRPADRQPAATPDCSRGGRAGTGSQRRVEGVDRARGARPCHPLGGASFLPGLASDGRMRGRRRGGLGGHSAGTRVCTGRPIPLCPRRPRHAFLPPGRPSGLARVVARSSGLQAAGRPAHVGDGSGRLVAAAAQPPSAGGRGPAERASNSGRRLFLGSYE